MPHVSDTTYPNKRYPGPLFLPLLIGWLADSCFLSTATAIVNETVDTHKCLEFESKNIVKLISVLNEVERSAKGRIIRLE